MPELDTLKKKYSIAPAPESVARLTQLVAKRMEDLDGIVKLINADAGFKQRLLLAANRGDPDGLIQDAEEAIMRAGIASVLVLAMVDPLARGVIKTFATMANMKLELEPSVQHESIGPYFVGKADFNGHAGGSVHFRLREPIARSAAAQILGEDANLLALEMVSDVVGELTNMAVGNFKSNLCDSGLPCKLSTPSVQYVETLALPKVIPGRRQELVFQCDGKIFSVFVTVEHLE